MNNTFHINKITNPKGLKKDQYDVIIIGAGIGGLVCGCYLAKAGMKVLIVEKNSKPGGYCQSFTRNGFTFDVGIHTLVSCREDGLLGRVIRELELEDYVKLIRVDPSDVIVNAGYKIIIRNNINHTISDLQDKFPQEATNIVNFFTFIKKIPFLPSFLDFKNRTFRDVLDMYFTDTRLKSILNVLLGNLGLPSYRVSALAALALYREHIFDGGYYPLGGMQSFSDAFAKRFKDYGGEILFSNKVTNIKVENKIVKGVTINKDNFIKATYVISACDVTQVFLELIGEENCDKKFIKDLKAMLPSTSAFLVFLGIKKDLRKDIDNCCGLWYFPISDIDKCWEESQKRIFELGDSIFCMFPSFHSKGLAPETCTSVVLMVIVPFKNPNYWERNKLKFEEKIIERLEKIIGDVSNLLLTRETLTPYELYKYTLNINGSIRGWLPTFNQLNSNLIKGNTEFENLFIVGHWLISSIGQGGISMVGDSGRKIAKLLLRKVEQ